MRTLVMATIGLPTIVLTAAVVMLVCFWLLVAVRLTAVGTFDEDADLGPWGMGGVPVAVALSLLTSVAWFLSVGGTLALAALALPDLAAGLLRLAVPVGALLVAWRLTCLFVRPLHRLFPDERGPSRPGGPPALPELTEGRAGRVLRPAPDAAPGGQPQMLP
ncbi:hypothetical protein STRCI_007182 [Streptomyces cinnabarinus]|uniref:Integral membrane protein n=1 Tax=Streptomyces cinnabarinus TaxID=67287 RepID=A0ABY7KRE5_9ACTN|nr:hypothetical protein [Streptomyces cinnabarinus]WAZ25672.1 hypothetical protein STRCI_007182 [Streptomyces cinnabarinus]